eukprot:GHRR01026917.1.p1 GENE.GHRR01026917.1~~GHRR01026917.1.p1  ORF type:complete len:112 (+),score=16.42 GHRR01026917.1:135-470(+)
MYCHLHTYNATDLLCQRICMQVCKEHRLHPHNPTAAQVHTAKCRKMADTIARRLQDGAIECGICLEKVLSKPVLSQRRFGLMFCDHAFCLDCIRNWRSTAEVDRNTVGSVY